MAEMPDEEKDLVSHRGNAVRAMLPVIERLTGNGNRNA
jgi:inosine/xanthosine triphosphate pyrophosphatase family protein